MIVGMSGKFYKVMYNTAGNYGYVSMDYVYVDLVSGFDACLQVNNISGNLNMRSEANTSSSVVVSLPANTYISNGGWSNASWYRAVYANKLGYVNKSYVTPVYF